MKLKRPPLIASVMAVVGVAVLCGLGNWQLERLTWKEEILSKIEAEKGVDASQRLLEFEDFAPEQFYQCGTLMGEFNHDLEIALGPRTLKGQSGYHLYTPLDLEDGRMVLVNRGWISAKFREPSSRPGTLQQGQVRLTGMIAQAPQPNYFTPENDREGGQWYRVDWDFLEQESGRDFAPAVLWAEAPEEGEQVLKVAPLGGLKNDHLQYAFFWFSMAGALIVIFFFRFLRV